MKYNLYIQMDFDWLSVLLLIITTLRNNNIVSHSYRYSCGVSLSLLGIVPGCGRPLQNVFTQAAALWEEALLIYSNATNVLADNSELRLSVIAFCLKAPPLSFMFILCDGSLGAPGLDFH